MSNLDLRLISGDKSSVLLAASEFGEAGTELSNQFLANMKARSQRLRELYSELTRGMVPSVELELCQLGETLFNGLFTGAILNLFNRTVGGAEEGRITIRLMLSHPDLNLIHWEVMRFRDEFVGFRHNLLRHPFVSHPVRIPGQQRKKLHICAVAVDPIYGPETVQVEHRNLVTLFDGFKDQIRLTPLVQRDATVDNILDVLFDGVDVLHFCGHGLFDVQNPVDSALVVWPSGQEQFGRMSIRMLTTMAVNQNLGFCFLNACDTARSSERAAESKETRQTEESFVNMAHSLIVAGVPMVVATNHQITVSAATILSRRFYTGIIKHGRRVDQSLRDARAELFLRRGESVSPSDWSCPVLYARSRHMGLGTEHLKWESSFNIYSVRNVEPPQMLVRENDYQR